MNEYTRLVRPEQSQVQIEPTAQDAPSDGFNYPTFRMLNKQGRVNISPASLPLDPSNDYRLFAIANSKGWFAAAALQKDGSSCVLLSPLEELRAAFKTAKEGSEELFSAKRVLSLETSKPVALTFANNDTRLIIGFEQGQVLVYDAATILTAGTNTVTPIHVLNTTSAPIRQVCANPGSDAGHSDAIAIVRGDGTVTLVNSSLEPQGGWQAGDESTTPVAAAWSPKGKHLAIGLKSGDILTYPLTNKESVYKHIPPTSEPPLTYLEWLGPGHVFRTIYSPAGSDALQHIICLDSKTNRAVYFAPNYPFPLSDREKYQPISLYLPKWDEDAGSTESKSLLVVGDRTSVDLEVLGSTGTQWYQQSQENPLSLPLDKNQDDTILVSLEADLTNSSTSTPIMYAYLNDGTLQGWSLEHSKPYQGMITPGAAPVTTATSSTTTPAFGQSSFGATPASTTSAFGSTSAFGQPNPPSAFGSAAPAPTFGGSSFGQPSTTSAFGQPSAFGSSATTTAFGSSAAPATSAFGGSGSSFGSNTGGGFGAFSKPGGTAAFGQPGFGFGAAPTTTTTTSSLAPPSAPDMTREESMADGTATPPAPASGFGGLSLGGDSNSSDATGKSGIFGSFGSSTSTAPSESTSAFGSVVKPASGFGAFGSFKPGSAFGSTSTETPNTTGSSAATPSSASTQPAFGQSSFGQSTFGKSSFGQSTTSAFGQSGFGQPSKFGQSSFGNPAPTTTNVPSSGGFSSFASTPTSFSASTQQTPGPAFAATPSSTTGGFSAFASSSNASPFSLSVTAPQESAFGSKPSAFATDSSSSFAARNDTTSPFAASSTTASSSPFAKPEAPPAQKPSGIITPQDSPPTTPTAQPSMVESDKEDSPTPAFSSTPAKSPASAFGGAFGGLQASPSPFKPSTGFGAFGASTTPESSPFFKSKPQESTTPALTAFSANPASTKSSTASTTPIAAPAFGASSSLGASAFGAKSTFGSFASPAPKSAFSPAASTTPTPVATPSSGGFSAFTGSSSAFASSTSAQPKSFKDLLKSKDDAPANKSSDDIFTKKAEEESTTAPDAGSNQDTKPLARQDTDPSPVKEESSARSFENLSLLSQASSYADISHASEEEDALESEGETDEHPSDHDDLPEEESEEESDVEEDSVLSGSEADYSRDIENSGDEEEVSEDPINVPLPPSRSGSQTPQKDVPVLQFTPSSSPSEQEGSILDTIPEEKEDTTTPPGTPIKQPTPVKAKAPPPTPPPPFGLGIGSKSTRPARSSPLASASVSSNDDEEDEKIPKRDQDAKAPSPFQQPLKPDEDQKTTRPKTPPLLGTVAPTKSDPFGSSPIPPKSAFSTPTPIQTPSSGFFSKPATATTASSTPFSQSQPQTTSFFGSPSIFSQPQTQPKPGLGAFSLPTAKQEEAPKLGLGAFSLPAAKQEEAPKPGLGAFGLPTAKQEEAPKPFSGFPLPKAAEKAENKPTQPSLFQGLSFGKDASKQPLATLSAPATPSPAFGLGAFNLGSKPAERPASSPLLTPAAAGAPVVSTPTTVIKPEAKSPPVPTPEATLATMEIGMQRECASLVMFLQQELHNLAQVATRHSQIRTELSKSLGGSRHKVDLGETKKWGVADSEQFGHVLKQYEKDLDALKEQRANLRQSLKEVQSSMLKAGTRKEEIARFNKAKTDKEFAKMLKARTLGPEHLETQTQLRRNIRTIRDRIQKLEDHLQTSKKKLAQVKSGKPMLRAPTLDTINRTYRNIDVAVQQQADDVSRLTKRVAKLNMGTPIKPSATHRDARLPDPLQVTHNPTPSYAIRSAAALNAERSAARLKRALLAVRKEPLLNTEAVGVAPTPDPSTGKMAITGATTSTLAITDAPATPGLKLPASMPLFSAPTPAAQPPPPEAPAADPAFDFSLPPDNFDPTHTPPSMRRGATGGAKKHTPAPVFKGSGQTGSPTSAPSFNWGPLPAFSPPTQTSKVGPSKFFSFTKP